VKAWQGHRTSHLQDNIYSNRNYTHSGHWPVTHLYK